MSTAATSVNPVYFGIRFKRDYFNDANYVSAVVRKRSTKQVTEFRYRPTDLSIPKHWKQDHVAKRNLSDIVKELDVPVEHLELVKLVNEGGQWVEIQ